jgi:hypothetical protein
VKAAEVWSGRIGIHVWGKLSSKGYICSSSTEKLSLIASISLAVQGKTQKTESLLFINIKMPSATLSPYKQVPETKEDLGWAELVTLDLA